ncbi:MAG: hypothetical protein DMH00_08265 [Acidobacteria bacterium]|nr:MAG: hypothetical protein DMH00_08265 [Acidobacteriota bacterium]
MNVLVADDDPLFRTLVKRFLQAESAVAVVWEAANGEEAILISEERHPDLILVDIALTRINGLEATRLIKSRHSEIKVLVVSLQGEQTYRRAALECGADAYYSKSECRDALKHIGDEMQAVHPLRR